MRRIRFHGGPADGRELEVPDVALKRKIHVKSFADGVVLYINERDGTTDYVWFDSDGETVHYTVDVDG